MFKWKLTNCVEKFRNTKKKEGNSSKDEQQTSFGRFIVYWLPSQQLKRLCKGCHDVSVKIKCHDQLKDEKKTATGIKQICMLKYT